MIDLELHISVSEQFLRGPEVDDEDAAELIAAEAARMARRATLEKIKELRNA